jgi:hypothetical protein
VGQAHVAPAQLDLGQLHGLATMSCTSASVRLGSLLFHKGADALDDLARALGLARGFSSAPAGPLR